MNHLFTAIIHGLLLQEKSSTIIINNPGKYIGIVNSSRLHFLYCKWSLELQVHNVYTRIQFNVYLYKDPNQGSHLYKDHINLYIYQCHIKISSRSFISFSPPNDKKILEIWSYDQCFQDIFIFRNLMNHILCHHYVHMTHVKFLQETDQMISTGRDLVFLIYLDKYQLDFTLSYVRALGSRTLHIYQGLSCL